jgi:hypothetical protein
MTAEHDEPALASIKRQLDATDGGPAVKDNIKRHYENLETLAANLRKLGMDDREVDESVTSVFKEYERELTAYLQLPSRAAA